jgi:hypothetical protein
VSGKARKLQSFIPTLQSHHFHLPYAIPWGHGHDSASNATALKPSNNGDGDVAAGRPFYRCAHDLWGKTGIYQNIRSRRTAALRRAATSGKGVENEIPRSVPGGRTCG